MKIHTRMKKIFHILLCLGLFASLNGCVAPKGVDVTRYGLDDATIAADLAVFPQDLKAYADKEGRDARLMDPSRQGQEDARFDENFFAPWSGNIPHQPVDAAFEGARNMSPSTGFAENLRRWDEVRWREVVENANERAYGTQPSRPAITVGTAHLRRLPTDAPYFLDPNKGGEGFPFDYMQNSVLWLGTPVAIMHLSQDRLWAYVQTRPVSGWTRVANLAAVDAAFAKFWRSRPMGAIVRDGTVLGLTNEKADAVTGTRTTVEAQLGTVLPFATHGGHIRSAKSPHVFIHVPQRSPDGRAVPGTAMVPIQSVRRKPMFLTPGNIAQVGNAMMGQPYGWGGLFGQRDCSSAMRDLFTPFGIWLPRNSSVQARMGTWLDVGNLTPDAKEEAIMREGVPFLSLVSLRGHVGLYLGTWPRTDDQGVKREVPVMFHNLWGIRVADGSGDARQEGRGVIGKAVVTGLRPGSEHPAITSPASILDRINGLAILPEPLPGEQGK